MASNGGNPEDDRENADRAVASHEATTAENIAPLQADQESVEGIPPPLPPRPAARPIEGQTGLSAIDSSLSMRSASKGQLQSRPTTALSLAAINTQAFQDGSRETYFSFPERSGIERNLKSQPSLGQLGGIRRSEAGDASSIRSDFPRGSETPFEDGSVLGELSGLYQNISVGKSEESLEAAAVAASDMEVDDDLSENFNHEFDPIGEIEPGEANTGRPAISKVRIRVI
jgi:hypothetical protein